MTSIIITASKKSLADEKITELYNQYQITLFDRTIIDIPTTIGIEEIRLIQQKIYFKPLQGQQKAIVIYNAHTLTIEAQNAFLKTLEEPPPYTYIIMVANTTEVFLPTILSRCSIIAIEEEKESLTEKETSDIQNTFVKITENDIGQKLFYAQTIGEKQENALVWLGKAIQFSRLQLLDDEDSQNQFYYLSLLEQLQETYKIIKTTNVNPRFALENLFLGL